MLAGLYPADQQVPGNLIQGVMASDVLEYGKKLPFRKQGGAMHTAHALMKHRVFVHLFPEGTQLIVRQNEFVIA